PMHEVNEDPEALRQRLPVAVKNDLVALETIHRDPHAARQYPVAVDRLWQGEHLESGHQEADEYVPVLQPETEVLVIAADRFPGLAAEHGTRAAEAIARRSEGQVPSEEDPRPRPGLGRPGDVFEHVERAGDSSAAGRLDGSDHAGDELRPGVVVIVDEHEK